MRRPPRTKVSIPSRCSTASAIARSRSRSISTLKWPAFARIAPSFMRGKWRSLITPTFPVVVTKMSPHRGRLVHGHHVEAVHVRLERATRVDLGHDHPGAHPLRLPREAPPAVAVPGHDEPLARDQHVRGDHQRCEHRLARAVDVVERPLHRGVVHGDDGELELSRRPPSPGAGGCRSWSPRTRRSPRRGARAEPCGAGGSGPCRRRWSRSAGCRAPGRSRRSTRRPGRRAAHSTWTSSNFPSAAATSSWVERGLQPVIATSAPPAARARTRFAVLAST